MWLQAWSLLAGHRSSPCSSVPAPHFLSQALQEAAGSTWESRGPAPRPVAGGPAHPHLAIERQPGSPLHVGRALRSRNQALGRHCLALWCSGLAPDLTVQKHSELKRGLAGLFLFVLESGRNENGAKKKQARIRGGKTSPILTEDCPLLSRPHQHSGQWSQDHTGRAGRDLTRSSLTAS